MHFARAWIGKASIDSAGKKRAHQALGTVHGAFFHYRSVSLMVLPAVRAPIVVGIFPSHFLSNAFRSAMSLARSLHGNRREAASDASSFVRIAVLAVLTSAALFRIGSVGCICR